MSKRKLVESTLRANPRGLSLPEISKITNIKLPLVEKIINKIQSEPGFKARLVPEHVRFQLKA